jgi:hexosaminidase
VNNDIFYFTEGISIVTTIKYLSDYLEETLAIDKGISTISSSKSQIQLILDETNVLEEEGYELEILNEVISIISSSEKGLFYGIQTLRQLIQTENDKNFAEGVKIRDKPRFGWRGFMLDVCRHYQPIETIKKLIDILALLKFSVFHLHLSEDQGWRIEIQKYPKLMEIGSKRKDTKIKSHISPHFRGKPHEGFYTQHEIRDIIQYASDRYIDVVPEIDIPGHSSAAIASYSHLSCNEKQLEVKTRPGIYFDILCAGKESTFKFLEDVFDEIIDLFPSPYVHIGGDEAPKLRWRSCEHCQNRIKEENLKNPHELHEYFTNRIGQYIKSKGKKVIGWNEILGDSVDEDTIVQWWRGHPKKTRKLIERGRKFIISRFRNTYLDYNYLKNPMRNFYFEPVPFPRGKYEKGILGVETPLWTEWVPNIERLGWQVFPRLLAIAEVAWTDKNLKNYSDFKKRVPNFLPFLDKLKIPYAQLEEVDPSNFKRYTQVRKWIIRPEE